jgi:membrane protein implicated in regulation of membrane protease activity
LFVQGGFQLFLIGLPLVGRLIWRWLMLCLGFRFLLIGLLAVLFGFLGLVHLALGAFRILALLFVILGGLSFWSGTLRSRIGEESQRPSRETSPLQATSPGQCPGSQPCL